MSKQQIGVLRIGTSGIVVPGSKESYPAGYENKSRLNYYSSLFNTVEINSTFRKIPRVSTFERWANEVPDDFLFTIKLWKQITHIKQLEIDLANIDTFLDAANHIGVKKGCFLVQFPGSITAEYFLQVEQILERLCKLDQENTWRKAVELRSLTWYSDETLELLKRYNASLVLHDMPKSQNLQLQQSSPFIYFRFHGPKGDYRGGYGVTFLEEQATKIRGFLNEGRDVYVYFNNTMGDAFDNAQSLKAMVGE